MTPEASKYFYSTLFVERGTFATACTLLDDTQFTHALKNVQHVHGRNSRCFFFSFLFVSLFFSVFKFLLLLLLFSKPMTHISMYSPDLVFMHSERASIELVTHPNPIGSPQYAMPACRRKSKMQAHYQRMHDLRMRLIRLLAVGLGLEPEDFAKFFSKLTAALRLLHYSSEVFTDHPLYILILFHVLVGHLAIVMKSLTHLTSILFRTSCFLTVRQGIGRRKHLKYREFILPDVFFSPPFLPFSCLPSKNALRLVSCARRLLSAYRIAMADARSTDGRYAHDPQQTHSRIFLVPRSCSIALIAPLTFSHKFSPWIC